MHAKLVAIVGEYDRLSHEMSTQEVASNPDQYRQRATKQAQIRELVECFRECEALEKRLVEAEQMLREESDPEMRDMAEQEKRDLLVKLADIESALKILLLPKDPNDAKNTIMEIRAGTGGDEAALFVADLFEMYSRYAEHKKWRVEMLSLNETGLGGYKEVSFKITGDNVYSQLKYEGGVHRVQRVPATEAQGRIHTSAVTVAVLPEAEEVDIVIDPADLDIQICRSSGAGGQHVNTTDSAIKIIHKPSGLMVSCQDERSQHKNKAKALLVLRSRLLAAKQDEEDSARAANRKSQVGSGDRSEKIRTYNYPENRITDHRINLSIYQLKTTMREGDIQDFIDALIAADRAEKMAQN
ncbi:MAG: peptide chain release factor 1 [Candidatus Hydrogenedentes bacterium]|nr:peptide chain release factor 1 [Candidatus Hydrogenedentota bacterium]